MPRKAEDKDANITWSLSPTGQSRPNRSLAELRMARHYGWDLDSLRGKLPEARAADSYRLLNSHSLLFQLRPRIDLVRVPCWRRFGNAVQQLTNAFRIAEALALGPFSSCNPTPFLRVGELAISSLFGVIISPYYRPSKASFST